MLDSNTEGMTVISNHFEYCEQGKTINYNKNLIYTLNKQLFLYKQIQRPNVILLGDILDDSTIACDTKHENVVRIGFLNVNSEDKFEQFSKKFDIVICEDGSLCPVISIINNVLGKIQIFDDQI